MILWLLLFLATYVLGKIYFVNVVNIVGASIPTQPVIPTANACLQGCFESGSIVNAAFDLLNFKSIAVDIENFCSLNSALLKCGRECPAEQVNELEARTHASQFICGNKVEEFRLVSGCLEGAADVTSNCASECAVPTDVPLRLDSAPAASVNPTVFLDGVAGTCKKHICLLRCAQKGFNKECAGAGDLFKDVARHQVMSGIETLTMASNDENATTLHFMAENYLKNLPSECGFLKDLDEFDKVLKEETSTSSTPSDASTMAPSAGTTEEIVADEEKQPSTEIATQTDAEEATTKDSAVSEPVFVMDSADDAEIVRSTIAPPPELPEEEPAEVKPAEETTTIAPVEPVQITEEVVGEATTEETKTNEGVDENAVQPTTVAATEPVIVVDDVPPSDFGENSIQAGKQEEVKASGTGTFVVTTLLAVAAAAALI
ncbi:unnamed protein product [Nippostrongylus brasiliensis]|uniref:Chondroitin proteoglycan 4 domain-containing protein n=1 Tax=Nippostrongylus brasiliensis TaxID=27835 RepID=A0A0N4XUQ5_NIPBR|nr:unnamed protein product [Nippostrongylus brasiliensis]